VPNATVTVTDSSGVIRSPQSDKNGNYAFAGLTPGSYTLQASFAASRNIIDHNNPRPIIGDITSPFFGRAN
jgi:hypothetical protein